VVDAFGFVPFFIYTALLGVPAIILIKYLIHRPITTLPEK